MLQSTAHPLYYTNSFIIEIHEACQTSHDSLEKLKVKLQREWAWILQEVLCASYNAFQRRLKQIIENKGGYIE